MFVVQTSIFPVKKKLGCSKSVNDSHWGYIGHFYLGNIGKSPKVAKHHHYIGNIGQFYPDLFPMYHPL
jgi:hypothetical protein